MRYQLNKWDGVHGPEPMYSPLITSIFAWILLTERTENTNYRDKRLIYTGVCLRQSGLPSLRVVNDRPKAGCSAMETKQEFVTM
jgi:hypothetical protein